MAKVRFPRLFIDPKTGELRYPNKGELGYEDGIEVPDFGSAHPKGSLRDVLTGCVLMPVVAAALCIFVLILTIVVVLGHRISKAVRRGENPITKVFLVPPEAYVDFSKEMFDAQNMVITPLGGFTYNQRFPEMFGGTWCMTEVGGEFNGTISVEKDGQYDLRVWDGSSFDDLRHTNGYSPVTIRINSEAIAENFSPPPAEGHGGTDGLQLEEWIISLHRGENTLRWTFGQGTTQYWIQRIEVRRRAEGAVWKLESSQVIGLCLLGGIVVPGIAVLIYVNRRR